MVLEVLVVRMSVMSWWHCDSLVVNKLPVGVPSIAPMMIVVGHIGRQLGLPNGIGIHPKSSFAIHIPVSMVASSPMWGSSFGNTKSRHLPALMLGSSFSCVAELVSTFGLETGMPL
jgi:hypothetical protein